MNLLVFRCFQCRISSRLNKSMEPAKSSRPRYMSSVLSTTLHTSKGKLKCRDQTSKTRRDQTNFLNPRFVSQSCLTMFMYWKKLNIVSYCHKGLYVYIINPNITCYDVYIIKYHCLHYVYIVKLQRHSAFSSKLPGKAPRWHSTLRGAQGKPSGRRGSKLPWHRIITAVPQVGLVGVRGMSKFVWWFSRDVFQVSRCLYLFCPSHTIRWSECQNEEVNGSCTGTQRISRYRLASICMNSRNGQTFSCCRRWNFHEQRRCQHMGMDVVKVLTDSQKKSPSQHPSVSCSTCSCVPSKRSEADK